MNLFLIILFYYFNLFLSTDNLITRTTINYKFMSVGYTYLTDTTWLSITTPNKEFQQSVIVLLGLPAIAGQTSNDGFPAVPKMRNLASRNTDGSYTFSAKIVQANDSFCVKTWRIPTFLSSPIQVGWMVVEQGAWLIDGHRFIMGTGTVTRANSQTTATNANGNLNTIWYPTGCNATAPTENCRMPMSNRGAVGQVMTNNNVKQVGIDLFLSVRGKTVNERQTGWVLVPHDSSDASYFVLSAETLGYMIFETGINIACVERFFMEFSVYQMTNIKQTVNFKYYYNYIPGLFGTIGTVQSMVDATTLRTFDRSSRVASFITQEDQCVDQETDHITPETVYIFAIGESDINSTGTFDCQVQFNSALAPTPTPTTFPTRLPSVAPSSQPSLSPTRQPTTATPSTNPTITPSSAPTLTPTRLPTSNPTITPTSPPTLTPTLLPTRSPTSFPTRSPTSLPTSAPTFTPSSFPTFAPSSAPTLTPTRLPTSAPTFNPTSPPTLTPTSFPTFTPSSLPTRSPTSLPTSAPTFNPSSFPTLTPTSNPTRSPTSLPTSAPTFTPTSFPTFTPTSAPSTNPTRSPTSLPTSSPTFSPTPTTSSAPTFAPSRTPSVSPTYSPTSLPTAQPSASPTSNPSVSPTSFPTTSPTFSPTRSPTSFPTSSPTSSPTAVPSKTPSLTPTKSPTSKPTSFPTLSPTVYQCNDVPNFHVVVKR